MNGVLGHLIFWLNGANQSSDKKIQKIQNNFIDTVHIINTYWVISSIKFNR